MGVDVITSCIADIGWKYFAFHPLSEAVDYWCLLEEEESISSKSVVPGRFTLVQKMTDTHEFMRHTN